MEGIPRFLYHYTSVDVLALILSNQTIRFRRLDLMDDPHEAVSRDLGRQGRFVMVSCWTDRREEELLTWSLYTNGLRGVRIRLPIFPFEKAFRVHQSDLPIRIADGEPFDSYVAAHDIYNDRYQIPGIDFEKSIIKVQYTDDEELLTPSVLRQGNGTAILLSELGKYKRTIWERQSEWRYTFPIFPMTREIVRESQKLNNGETIGRLVFEAMTREQEPGISFIDIPISKTALESLEISIGPRCSDSDRVIIDSLTNRFVPDAVVDESTLLGKIV